MSMPYRVHDPQFRTQCLQLLRSLVSTQLHLEVCVWVPPTRPELLSKHDK